MVAYGSFIILFFLLVAGILVITISPMINQSTEIVNEAIEDGEVSKKYTTWYNFSTGLAKAIPIFILISVAGWGIVRAIERRSET